MSNLMVLLDWLLTLAHNSNIWPNSVPLGDTDLHNLSDLDFDLSRSLKVRCGRCL